MANIQWTAKRIKQQARKVWGSKYDLSQIKEDGTKQILRIGCKKHGIFLKRVRTFLEGSGCIACANPAYVRSTETLSKLSQAQKGIPKGPSPLAFSLEEVLERLVSLHGTRYGYEKITDPKAKMFTLVCPVHGDFDKHRQDILYKAKTGCPACNGGGRLNTKQFIALAKENQPAQISYRKTIYVNGSTNVTMSCKEHGDFTTRPGVVLYNTGQIACPACNAVRIRNKRIASGRYPNPATSDAYKIYRMDVRRFTNQAFRKYKKPDTIRTRLSHVDHMFSIKDGFKYSVPPHIVGHITNLRMMPGKANQSKQANSVKTLKQLYTDFKNFEKRNK